MSPITEPAQFSLIDMSTNFIPFGYCSKIKEKASLIKLKVYLPAIITHRLYKKSVRMRKLKKEWRMWKVEVMKMKLQ